MKTEPRRAVLLVVAAAFLAPLPAPGADWPMWGGDPSRNMVSGAGGLPAAFDGGETRSGKTPREPSRNIKWIARLGSETYGNPTIAGGKVFVGTNNGHPRDPKYKGDRGVVMCFRESDGAFLWQLNVPKLKSQNNFNGDFKGLGICSSPTVEGGRVYVVTNRCAVLCLDANGLANGNDGPVRDEWRIFATPRQEKIAEDQAARRIVVERVPGEAFDLAATDADVIWRYDMMVESNVWPQDASNCNILLHGDYLYVCTSNGVDKSHRRVPCADAASLIVLDKRTGRLVARDDASIGPNILHGQWSSPSLGVVNGRELVFFGAGDGFCHAFDARPVGAGEGKVGLLRTVWKFDCNPADYRVRDGKPVPYQRQHKSRGDLSPCEVIGTPVFHDGRVYVTLGQDTRHGMAPGCLSCIDAAAGTGDITQTGEVWRRTEVDRSLSTPSVADGLVYVADYSGVLRCLEAETGKVLWEHDVRDRIWGSTFVADGKVYIGTKRGDVHILAAGREKKLLGEAPLDTSVFTTPVVANGVLYITSMTRLYAVQCGKPKR